MSVKRDPDGIMSARSCVCAVVGALFLSPVAGCTVASLHPNTVKPPASASTTPAKGQTATAGTPTTATPAQTTTTAQGTTTPQATATAVAAAPVATHHTRHRRTASRHHSTSRHRHVATHHAKKPDTSTSADGGTATKNAAFVDSNVRTGGDYPKFVPPKAATSQMTDAEKNAFQSRMAARMKANKQTTGETPAETAERQKLLRALAAKHGPDTLKQIEQ